eukprot:g33254.t1
MKKRKKQLLRKKEKMAINSQEPTQPTKDKHEVHARTDVTKTTRTDASKSEKQKRIGDEATRTDASKSKKQKRIGDEATRTDANKSEKQKRIADEATRTDMGKSEKQKRIGDEATRTDVSKSKKQKRIGDEASRTDMSKSKKQKRIGDEATRTDMSKSEKQKRIGDEAMRTDANKSEKQKRIGDEAMRTDATQSKKSKKQDLQPRTDIAKSDQQQRSKGTQGKNAHAPLGLAGLDREGERSQLQMSKEQKGPQDQARAQSKKQKKRAEGRTALSSQQEQEQVQEQARSSPKSQKRQRTDSVAAAHGESKEQPERVPVSFADQLRGSKFRWLNEKLYTCKGNEAMELFAKTPSLYQTYHEGFRSQVQSWPVLPVQVIIQEIRNKRDNGLVIVDMGCGDAAIAQALHSKHTIHSFDLVASNKFVTACNISKVPLADRSADMVVFCLSLMGTDMVNFLKEAHRILNSRGWLKIAEVESRLKEGVDRFISAVTALGFKLLRTDKSNSMFLLFDFQKVPRTEVAGKKSRGNSRQRRIYFKLYYASVSSVPLQEKMIVPLPSVFPLHLVPFVFAPSGHLFKFPLSFSYF